MKKICIIAVLIFCLSGCTAPKVKDAGNSGTAQSGVWISYSEINSMLLSENGFKNEFSQVLSNLKELEIENVYIHVRAFCDSLYPSKYFPKMKALDGYDYDVLEYITKTLKAENIKVHAWINPYRVSTSTTDVNTLDTDSPAYIWLNDQIPENDKNVCLSGGIYLNPAEAEVRNLVINGIKEILENYDVDGIHFDDYFYPTTEASFDEISYKNYSESNQNPLSLEDWRRNNVNLLISGCYDAVKYKNSDVIFSVSPMASLDKNYNNLYADVAEWINGEYVDVIIPQIYFGFSYPQEEFRFQNMLETWKKAVKNSNVGLCIGLGFYKGVPELEEDRQEWENNFDIISRQVEICKKDQTVEGYVYFSYSSLFSNQEPYKKQRENIIKAVNANG